MPATKFVLADRTSTKHPKWGGAGIGNMLATYSTHCRSTNSRKTRGRESSLGGGNSVSITRFGIRGSHLGKNSTSAGLAITIYTTIRQNHAVANVKLRAFDC